MIPGAQRFTGSSSLFGILVFIISSIILTAYWVLLFAVFRFFQRPIKKNTDAFINALVTAGIWVLGETLMAFVSLHMPWFLFKTGTAVSGNLYAIQPISFLGVNIASFIVVVVNYLFAYFIAEKKYKLVYIPASIFVVYMILGYCMYASFKQKTFSLKPIKAAVLTENIPPEMRWNDATGDALVNRLLNLAKESVALKPDIAVWSESTVPWTYRPDDDFVKEILTITKSANITQVIGINSDADTAKVYNSVYSILPGGKVLGRYDKRYLLGFIEQPFAGVIFPFLTSAGFVVVPGTSSNAIETPYGKAGILICNESTVASAAADVVNNDAQFILNMSNDGWFSNTYIATQHFYNARLRAIETRKDLIVNSNDGITGLIKASGEIASAQQRTEPHVSLEMIQPNDFKTLQTSSPDIMLYVAGLILVISFVGKMSTKKSN